MSVKPAGLGRLAVWAAIAAAASGVLADDQDAQRARWQNVYGEIAGSLRVYPREAGSSDFTLLDRPLLHYANPVRNWDQHGAVFLWTQGVRPAVIGSVWSVEDRQDPTRRKIALEFHSLDDEELIAERHERMLWRAAEPGLQWERCPQEVPPASSRALRLSQMRQLARSVSATIATSESELRLMPQPLYRYGEPADGAVDGAVFGFVMGTDPELFALIEARPLEQGLAWYWAFARFTHVGLMARSGEQLVFRCRHRRDSRDQTRYFVVFNAEYRPADLGETPE